MGCPESSGRYGANLGGVTGEADLNNGKDKYGQLEEARNNLTDESREAWQRSRRPFQCSRIQDAVTPQCPPESNLRGLSSAC